MKIPQLVGHRGYMAEYPENTLVGIEAALQTGACLVEFDVQMSGQGELIYCILWLICRSYDLIC